MLYVAHRLLTDPEVEVAQLETIEDATFLGKSGQVLDVVQVKAESAPLTVSSLRTSGLAARATRDSHTRTTLVSFSGFGSELARAVSGDEAAVVKLGEKLGPELSLMAPGDFLDRLRLFTANEGTLIDESCAVLGASVASVAPTTTLDLLLYWLWTRSESRASVTRADLHEEVTRVARYAETLASTSTEWFNTIVPLLSSNSPARDREELLREYSAGIAAQRDHILAGADALRRDKLNALDQLFTLTRTVVIHGASGQGKSTLALRYMEDHAPTSARFFVRGVRDEAQARRIGQSLVAHADAIRIPVFVHIDVGPADDGWITLAEELAASARVWTVATIRDEDWRKSGDIVSRVDLRSLALTFDESEARVIFDVLCERGTSRYPTFEDAWHAFDGGGPLLEFTYLVTQHQRLESRLKEQVRRLENELGEAELVLAQAVMRAAVCDAQVDIKLLNETHPTDRPGLVIERLRDEYVLRQLPGGALGGLHPIRSKILLDLLTDDALRPLSRASSIAIAAVSEADLEDLLLDSFSGRPESAQQAIAHLTARTLHTWTGLAGALRALLWLGVSRHVSDNSTLLQEGDDKFLIFGRGMFLAAAWDRADPQIEDMRRGLLIIRPDLEESSREYSARLPSVRFHDATHWLLSIRSFPQEPTLSETTAWSGLGEFLYWAQTLEVNLTSTTPINIGNIAELPALLASQVLFAAELVRGIKTPSDRATLVERLLISFAAEYNIFSIEENSGSVCATYVLPDHCVSGHGPKALNEALVRVEVLRALFPHAERVQARGVGRLRMFTKHDFSDSDRDLEASTIEPPWRRRWARILANLVRYPLRPASWTDYAAILTKKLSAAKRGLALVTRMARQHLSGGNALAAGSELSALAAEVRERLELPKCAVDPFGRSFSTEVERLNPGVDLVSAGNHAEFEKSISEYTNNVGNFLESASYGLFSAFGSTRTEKRHRKFIEKLAPSARIGTATSNIRSVYNNTNDVLREVEEHLGPLLPSPNSVGPTPGEAQEAWQVWELLDLQPHRREKSPDLVTRLAAAQFADWQAKRISDLYAEFAETSLDISRMRVVDTANTRNCLTLIVAVSSAERLLAELDLVEEVVRRLWLKPSRLSTAVFSTRWQHVVIVPVYQDKALNNLARRLNSLSLSYGMDSDFVFANFYEVSDLDLSALSLEKWDFASTAPDFVGLASALTEIQFTVAKAGDYLSVDVALFFPLVRSRTEARYYAELTEAANRAKNSLQRLSTCPPVQSRDGAFVMEWVSSLHTRSLVECVVSSAEFMEAGGRLSDALLLHFVNLNDAASRPVPSG